MMPQFIGAFLFVCALTVGGSLLWPKFMNGDPPYILQAVRDKVVETELGKQAEDILGAYTMPNDVPQAISSVSSQLTTQVGSTIQKKAEDVVTHRIIEEAIKRFDTLPSDEKENVRAAICQPAQQ